MTDFEEFWNHYPLRVGKLAAQREYEKVRKVHGATQAELLDGIDRYKRNKPAYADWAHARTWLHQGRWMDQYGKPNGNGSTQQPSTVQWMDECRRLHNGACGLSKSHHDARMKAQ